MHGAHRLTWFLAGAGAMYLADPDRGARRRAMLKDRAVGALHDVEDIAGKAGRDVRNRAGVLRDGRMPAHRMRRHTPERQLAEGIGGALLALWGVARGGILGLPVALGGLALVARTTTPRMRGHQLENDHLIRVQKTITVAVPLEEVYEFWTHVENFPRFMQHVLEVRQTSENLTHWKVMGPAGLPIEWDAKMTAMQPNKRIAWRSIDGSIVDHEGEIHFERVEGGTRINIHMGYLPPGGALGHAVAAFLAGDPKHLMDEDLLRLKSLLEDGKARVRGVDTRMPELH
jgi:uncharacterized membrane protein